MLIKVSTSYKIHCVILLTICSVTTFSSIFFLCVDSTGTVNYQQNIDFLSRLVAGVEDSLKRNF